jgi:membrane protein
VREVITGVVERFREHGLILRANALAFQLLGALVPFGFFVLGLSGFLGLSEVWEREVVPQLQRNVSVPAFVLIDDSVDQVLGSKSLVWVTLGLALALWQLSRSIRTGTIVLDELDGREDDRPRRELIPRSLLLAAGVAACVIGALCAGAVAPLVYGDVGTLASIGLTIVRYLVAGALLLLAVGLVVHFGPRHDRPVRWVSAGALLITVTWLAVTAAFGLYLTAVASYGSIYGALISVVALLTWSYLSALAFVVGAATDRGLRGD